LKILINDRFQFFPHSYNFLTKVRNLESLILESVSVGSVMEQVLPQIQEAILDQKAGSYRNWAPTQSWGLGKLQFYSLLFGILILDQRAGSHRNRRNGGELNASSTPTASSAPSELETDMRLFFYTSQQL
jgi:hypothetical protein